MQIKICGITNKNDALCAAKAGADYLGFIFYKKSLRYVSPEVCREIVAALRLLQQSGSDAAQIPKFVGVFVNETYDNIMQIKNNAGLDFIQLHGDEDLNFCKQFNLDEVIKVVRLGKSEKELQECLKSDLQYILLDKYEKNNYGGTGKTIDWDKAKDVFEQFKAKKILSGGLNCDNIKEAIAVSKPDIVDVSSGVEIEPGIKDCEKIEKIINIVC